MTPLTDAELSELERRVRELGAAWSSTAAGVQRLVDEVRAARVLLATPTDPPGTEQPEVVAMRDGSRRVAWCLDLEGVGDMTPDEAVGIGAALIRAALSARGGVR